MSTNSVFCVSPSRREAEGLVDQLKTANFTDHDISLLYPDADTARDSTHVLVSVATGNAGDISRVKAIFLGAGAVDICTSGDPAPSAATEIVSPLPASPSSVRYHCPA